MSDELGIVLVSVAVFPIAAVVAYCFATVVVVTWLDFVDALLPRRTPWRCDAIWRGDYATYRDLWRLNRAR